MKPMTDRIRLLPDNIANQIAAGEVVQRPASVVKELLENAIDAEATHIKLIVKDGGKSLIHVIDNGIGMSPNDARMSFERHATSKIKHADDLFRIRTMGFRGEALASIAAVAQVEMKTRLREADLGTLLRIEGSELITQEEVICPEGTSIAVKNLFFNVPARRKFLKSNAVEMQHIFQEFYRVALAHPSIHFELHHNQVEVYNLHPGKLSRRIVDLFGKQYRQLLIPCKEETPTVKIHGYIGTPQQAKKTRGEQFFFVNKRFIKHGYLHHAVMQAYADTLVEGTYPFYCLFIEIDPEQVDVNVHPTKTEVKFEDERTLYAFMLTTVQRALATHHIKPSLDFEISINFPESLSDVRSLHDKKPSEPGSLASSRQSESQDYKSKPSKQASKDWKRLFEDFEAEQTLNIPLEGEELELFQKMQQREQEQQNSKVIKVSSRLNQIEDEEEEAKQALSPESQPVFQLHEQYLVSQVKSGLLLINIKAAKQRILYDRFLQQIRSGKRFAQQVLFPERISLPTADRTLLQEISPQLQQVGFELEFLQSGEVLVRSVPSDLQDEPQHILEFFLEQYKQMHNDFSLAQDEKVARTLAARAAHRLPKRLSQEEMQSMIAQLFASSNPNFSPYGERILVILDAQQIAAMFE